MHLPPLPSRFPIRPFRVLVSLAWLAPLGCAPIPSVRYGETPLGPPAVIPAEDRLGEPLLVSNGACGAEPRAAAGPLPPSEDGPPHTATELPWPRFHPLPTTPLLGPGAPGWP